MLYEAERLAKEGEAFELIRTKDAYDRVLRRIYNTYKKTGRVLDVSEAMESVENELLAEAEKLAAIKKVQSKIALPAQALPSQPQQKRMTLTARDTAAPAMSRRARALAAFQGTLKR
jgi:pyruvate/2-oxoglutarate/acetoin dehydrogenase E1 component